MEIERKFLPKELPANLKDYPHAHLEQGYLCTNPVVRIRKEEDTYTLTYKSKGLLAREEYNLPLGKEGYDHLKSKVDGQIISKIRYRIPLSDGLTAELDIFQEPFCPLTLVEVEFSSVEEAHAFQPPAWFGEDVTCNPAYHNSTLSRISPKP